MQRAESFAAGGDPPEWFTALPQAQQDEALLVAQIYDAALGPAQEPRCGCRIRCPFETPDGGQVTMLVSLPLHYPDTAPSPPPPAALPAALPAPAAPPRAEADGRTKTQLKKDRKARKDAASALDASDAGPGEATPGPQDPQDPPAPLVPMAPQPLLQGYAAVVPVVHLRSTAVPQPTLVDLQEELRRACDGMAAEGAFDLLSLFGRAQEVVATLPPALSSHHFGCCVTCNMARLKAGSKKTPMPLRRADRGRWECLVCRNTEHVVAVPALLVNVADECSFCFCPDNPLLYAPCGCRCCFACFQSYADTTAVAGGLKVVPRHAEVGMPCPMHRGVVWYDPGLFKLLDTRVLLRFTAMAVADFAARVGAFQCPAPECAGFPTITDVQSRLQQCAYCRCWSCDECNAPINQCRCEGSVVAKAGSAPSKLLSLRADTGAGAMQPPPDALTALAARPDTPPSPVNAAARDQQRRRRAAEKDTAAAAADDGTAGQRGGPEDPEADPWYVSDAALAQRYDCVDVLLVNRDARAGLKLPLDAAPLWANRASRIMQQHVAQYVALHALFHGAPLHPGKTLREQGVYSGAVLFFVAQLKLYRTVAFHEEKDLVEFRQCVTASDEKVSEDTRGFGKKCPKCSRPVVHYFNHGCHHIGAHGSCCGHDWCYVCLGPMPCTKCPLMCRIGGCECPLCPSCRPMMPCPHCWGCPRCKPDGTSSAFE